MLPKGLFTVFTFSIIYRGDCRAFDLKIKTHSDKYSHDDVGLVMYFHREY